MKIGFFGTDYIKAKTKIERYIVGEYFVDVIDDGETYYAWLSRQGFGVSMLMFGASKSDMVNGKKQFLDMVDSNLLGYIDIYEKDYGDE